MQKGPNGRGGLPLARPRLLVVEDDPEMREFLTDTLTGEGFLTDSAGDGAEALIRLRAHPFAAVLLDKNMPGLSGLDLLPSLRTMCPDTPVILTTAFGDAETEQEAATKGAYAYLPKPFTTQSLLEAIRCALEPRDAVAPPHSAPRGSS
jgi:DNA-binding NtrC family response regulator